MSSTDINAVLSKLTLEEKISLLAGANFWETVSIPEKGVPAVKVSDGPNGARGETFNGGVTAACFPAGTSIASTFDVDLARRIGVALGEETRTKGARCLLGPTICIHRHPLGGRNFESFSEDPFLTGTLATQYVNGVESTGVSATVKHFAGNEQETERLSVKETISERALREIYLRPFELAIKNGKPGAVMTAYNIVNGDHCDSNSFLLNQVLRGEWGWDGLLMSDWGGVNSTVESIKTGLDLEMPGPTRWRKVDEVVAAVKAGKISEETINQRAMRILRFLERQKCFTDPSIPKEQAVNKPEHQALIREVGSKGIVLLKNDGILPLTKEKLRNKKVALLGYAKQALLHGGGSASVNPHYKVSPWDALHEAFKGENVEFAFAKGAETERQLPVLSENVVSLNGEPGFTFTLHEPGNPEPYETVGLIKDANVDLLTHSIPPNMDVKLSGIYTAPETAKFYTTLSGLGPSQLLIDGRIVFEQKENCSDSMGFILGGVVVPRLDISLEAGKQYKIEVISQPPMPIEGVDLGILEGKVGVRLGWVSGPKHDIDYLTDALDAAKAADYAIIFTGHEPSWETEGQDQASFNLPKEGSQDRLVASVADINPNTIVVNSTGVAVAMPWLDQVKAVLQTWFPGQEAGNAITDVLTGTQNPEGHLTCTFPKRLEDCPAHGNFPGTYEGRQLTVKYEEGVFIGYRHFDRLPADKVSFPFGFGLSYTTFGFSDLSVHEAGADGEYVASVNVSNTGGVKGAIAVQLYVGSTKRQPENPVKALVSFKKVTLEPGASVTAELPVRARDFAFWSEKDSRWFVDEGEYNFSIGKNAAELVASQTVKIGAQTWAP
ncbi:putative thermostable beta-glucosidase b protein [Phaeoacremonium minimum UCRPA7]|uniref:beta-glucosidase n=1 Tax=Phaeoacremonium minimum (strain UCR-PA7) TaxID=1286976 RepID=R8BPT1_PHAM7|nr:putative thermostable beta-glucosidase b protein [Phaeoacremonium minimum UCRPA7]EOO01315.1 putative thermostable beta-glucosidase b protein [Phaeoacremonium minimum UCRPA7]